MFYFLTFCFGSERGSLVLLGLASSACDEAVSEADNLQVLHNPLQQQRQQQQQHSKQQQQRQ